MTMFERTLSQQGNAMKKASNKMTPEMVKSIKVLLAEDKYFQHQIASLLNINQSRVSEVKQGLYG